ncbi:type II secretion system protein [Bacillus sp. FJAT-50079]|uniref:type IV pilus modification PilV family protein n=1 Tax=Bacillus sp. FJAT-50079 TaxID=2833577 RepID=UPI001BC9B5D4|nr:type II secretion system protein [Bacillus sp. FJAT-50079]MBS4208950.1 type II secretion system protein [Bacillus sp. FJAT-50079]
MKNSNSIILIEERGVTLIELLASIVLISIILMTFFTVFFQSATTHKTAEEIQDATYLAQTEMEAVYSSSISTSFNGSKNAILSLGYTFINDSNKELIFEKTLDTSMYARIRFQKDEIKPNMNHVIVEIVEKNAVRAKMETILLWRDESE